MKFTYIPIVMVTWLCICQDSQHCTLMRVIFFSMSKLNFKNEKKILILELRIECRLQEYQSPLPPYRLWINLSVDSEKRKRQILVLSLIKFYWTCDHVIYDCPCHNMTTNLVHSLHQWAANFPKPRMYLLAHCRLTKYVKHTCRHCVWGN